MAELLRVNGLGGVRIYAIGDGGVYSAEDARALYLDQTGYDAFEACESYKFDDCTDRQLEAFARTGDPCR